MRTFRRLTCLLALLCLAGVGGAREGEKTEKSEKPDPVSERFLQKVEGKLTSISTLSAGFTQKKKLSLIDHEIVIKGMLYLDKEGRLAWHVTSPIKYSCVIEEDTIKQWDEDSGDVTELSAEDHPGLKIVFRYLRSWFAGELSVLTKEFKYTADVGAKRLDFTPMKDSGAVAFVKKFSMEYREDLTYLRQITVIEANGDKTTITYSDVKLNEVIPAEIWNVIQD